MRRIAIAAVLVFLCVFHLAASEPTGNEPIPSNALLFELNYLTFSLGGNDWLVEFAIEYQRVLGDHFVLSLIPELTVGNIRNEFGALLGPIVHPFGGGLRGMFIGAHPGFAYASGSVYFIAEADVGYQWVLEHGIVVFLSIGGRHDSRIGIRRSGSFRIGFAF
jgi:hypothetical protein